MRILMVCLGNICRSPLAETVLRAQFAAAGLADRVTIDSAGTGDWNIGKPPDPRMVAAAAEAGLTLEGTARQIAREDLRDCDLILVMDRQNLADVRSLAPDEDTRNRVHLFLEYSGGSGEVPDPYKADGQAFADVVTLIRDSARGVVAAVQRTLQDA